jgi:peptide subunit release factor 1 (eRF1)
MSLIQNDVFKETVKESTEICEECGKDKMKEECDEDCADRLLREAEDEGEAMGDLLDRNN